MSTIVGGTQRAGSIFEHSVVLAAEHQVSSELGGEVVILNLQNGTYYGLDEVGAQIWSLLQQPVKVEHICERLLEEYEVEADTCLNDVLTLLTELEAQGLVKVGEAGRLSNH